MEVVSFMIHDSCLSDIGTVGPINSCRNIIPVCKNSSIDGLPLVGNPNHERITNGFYIEMLNPLCK
jgi:hypothetical protein